jgi:hypothetical protein
MTTKLLVLASAGVLAFAAQARADEWHDPQLRSNVGMTMNAGGGIIGFTDSAMRGLMANGVSPLWDVRASLGTHIPLGLDVSYLGSASPLRVLGEDDGNLIGTTVEAAVRYNILPRLTWEPYVFAGVGWQRYDVQSVQLRESDSGISREDNLAEFPLGAGISYRKGDGLVADVRGTFRPATASTLVLEDNGDHAKMQSWEASAAIGYEF